MKNIIFVLSIAGLLLFSCNRNYEPYEDEDLVYKYIQDNDTLFNGSNDYYLLFYKSPILTCVNSSLNYQADPLIQGHLDTAGNIPLFVITNSSMLKKWSELFYKGKTSLVLHQEKYGTMESYGVPYTPLLFHIENGQITQWRYLKEEEETGAP